MNHRASLMTKWTASLMAGCLLLSGSGLMAQSDGAQPGLAPTPMVVTDAWAIDIKLEKPRPIAVEDLQGNLKWYWYMPYTVTNNTGENQLFIPDVVIATDMGHIVPAGKNVPNNVFRAIKDRLGNDLLESPIEVVGSLFRGPDFAKESVVIWPDFAQATGSDVDEVVVFFGGLSGETASMAHPIDPINVLVRRTTMLRYDYGGNPSSPQDQKVELIEKTDVMR